MNLRKPGTLYHTNESEGIESTAAREVDLPEAPIHQRTNSTINTDLNSNERSKITFDHRSMKLALQCLFCTGGLSLTGAIGRYEQQSVTWGVLIKLLILNVLVCTGSDALMHTHLL